MNTKVKIKYNKQIKSPIKLAAGQYWMYFNEEQEEDDLFILSSLVDFKKPTYVLVSVKDGRNWHDPQTDIQEVFAGSNMFTLVTSVTITLD